MANFDSSKDRILAQVEINLSAEGKPTCKPATSVAQPTKESGDTRYRLAVASYNGGRPKLRRQTVYTTAKGEERVSSASSLPIEHVDAMGKLAVGFAAKVTAAMGARKAS